MYIDFLIKKFQKNKNKNAIVWNDKYYTYEWLHDRYIFWIKELKKNNLKEGSVVIVEADFSPNSVSLMLAIIEYNCIFVPITKSIAAKRSEFIKIAQGEVLIIVNKDDSVNISKLSNVANHELYVKLKEIRHPGLVLFSSGSTGESKASLHDITKILKKFKIERHTLRTITFLLYDHIGGFNTLLYILSNAGLIITLTDRSPENVLDMISRYKVELLPTSPTFLNLMLLSEAYRKRDISSLKMITYGTEPMPKSTLEKFNLLFPDIKMLQTYGLSEVGILRSKSKSSNSLWMKIGGEGFETRVVNNLLEIKAESAMLGYLNAPTPFTHDGWFKTGDSVLVDGEYFKILGRKSEIINVGGEKVYPQEVENIILKVNNISEVTVFSEKNPIMGNMVCANVRLHEFEEKKKIIKKIKIMCLKYLQKYKVPVKITIVDKDQYNARFKKIR